MQGGKTIQDLIKEQEEAEMLKKFVDEEEKAKQAELERQREQRRQMMANAFNRNKGQQQQQQQIEQNKPKEQQKPDPEQERKQKELEKQREQRRQMMSQAFDKDRLAASQFQIDDSHVQVQNSQAERIVDRKEQETLNQRANLFKHKQQQMQQDILNQEEQTNMMKKYEQDAMQEIIDEKRAEVRAKTINITSKIEQNKIEQAIDNSSRVQEEDTCIQGHQEWLMKRLYEQREQSGDMAFQFPDGSVIKCHSHILRSKSPYFDGLMKFTDQRQQSSFFIERYSLSSFKSMIEYFYIGSCTINSNDIIELFEICQEYMLPDLKQLLEQIMVGNLDQDNFVDNLQVARSFECKIMKEALYNFARKNYQEMYRKGLIKNLTREEFNIVKPNNI